MTAPDAALDKLIADLKARAADPGRRADVIVGAFSAIEVAPSVDAWLTTWVGAEPRRSRPPSRWIAGRSRRPAGRGRRSRR
jgi:hypothetical protein